MRRIAARTHGSWSRRRSRAFRCGIGAGRLARDLAALRPDRAVTAYDGTPDRRPSSAGARRARDRRAPGAVCIVAVDGEGCVTLVRQLREATRGELLEIPAGTRRAGGGAVGDGEARAGGGDRPDGRPVARGGGLLDDAGVHARADDALLRRGRRGRRGEPGGGRVVRARPLAGRGDRARLGEIEDAKSLVGLLLYLRDLSTGRPRRRSWTPPAAAYCGDARRVTKADETCRSFQALTSARREDRRRQGDQDRRVPRRADTRPARSSSSSAATRCSSRRAPATAARSRTPHYEASARASLGVDEVWARADLLLKVKEPIADRVPAAARGARCSSPTSTSPPTSRSRGRSSTSGAAGVAYETVETANGALPLLAPMSEIAGRLAAQAGAYFLEKPFGGRGLLLGGVAGRRARPRGRHRRRDRRLQRRDHRDRPRRAGDDPRALDRPDAPPRGDPLRPRHAADVVDAPDRGVDRATPTS